jgi:hypothetical protein
MDRGARQKAQVAMTVAARCLVASIVRPAQAAEVDSARGSFLRGAVGSVDGEPNCTWLATAMNVVSG